MLRGLFANAVTPSEKCQVPASVQQDVVGDFLSEECPVLGASNKALARPGGRRTM